MNNKQGVIVYLYIVNFSRVYPKCLGEQQTTRSTLFLLFLKDPKM